MLDLWLKILDIMDRLMNSGQGDNLVGSTPRLSIKSSSFSPRKANQSITPYIGGSGARKFEEHFTGHGEWRLSRAAIGKVRGLGTLE